MIRPAIAMAAALLVGCSGAQTVATDVETLERAVATRCRMEWPQKPKPYVELVQLTGAQLVDLVLVWRAAEAELEERIAYEIKLEAAARKCIE
jgi:hypothetical protein